MARGPNDLVLRILREIQTTLADHTRRFEAMDGRFDALERSMREVRESTITALGLAGHANVRSDSLEQRVEALERRVDDLETTRS